MPRSVVRFTIQTDSGERALFTVRDRPRDGDLHIDYMTGPYLGYEGDKGRSIDRQKYSVHPTPRVPDGNAIKTTVFLADGEELYVRQFTTALKQGRKFALLFTRRFFDLRRGPPARQNKEDRICLGRIDPAFSLLLCVLVSPADRAFEPPSEPDKFSIIQRAFSQVRVTVLWTFLSFPAGDHGESMHVSTERAEQINDPMMRDANERTMMGDDEAECIEGFYSACEDLIDSLKFLKIREMRAAGESEFAVTLMCNSFAIFKVASRDTAEWQAYKDRMKPIFDELRVADRASRRQIRPQP